MPVVSETNRKQITDFIEVCKMPIFSFAIVVDIFPRIVTKTELRYN